jgi:hypothetical protein
VVTVVQALQAGDNLLDWLLSLGKCWLNALLFKAAGCCQY